MVNKKILLNKRIWLSITLICLVFSVGSLFLPILTYQDPAGKSYGFNLLEFMNPGDFAKILDQYTGSVRFNMDRQLIPAFAAIGVMAIVAAFAGVITMSAQKTNHWQFVMAMTGLVGTLLPSVAVFILVISSVRDFPGNFLLGAYPVVTPVAMGLCIYMVTRKRKLTKDEQRVEQIARQYWHSVSDVNE